jgi:hypothetical protein
MEALLSTLSASNVPCSEKNKGRGLGGEGRERRGVEGRKNV